MDDELIIKAIEIAKENYDNFCSNLLKRKLKIGGIKCSKLLEILENKKIISPYNSEEKRRNVLIR